MATRTAYAPVAGSVLTAANLAKLPGGWIGYIEVTASQTGITTGSDLTSLTLTVTVGTGRRIRVSGLGQMLSTAGSPAFTPFIQILEGATILQPAVSSQTALGTTVSLAPSVILTPTSGSHTYKLQAGANSGTWTMAASSTAPAYILVEDLGATP